MHLLIMVAYTLVMLLLSSLYAQQSFGARLISTDVELSQGAYIDTSDAPWFCRGAPCPPFEVISKTQTYELREYSRSTLCGPDALATSLSCQMH